MKLDNLADFWISCVDSSPCCLYLRRRGGWFNLADLTEIQRNEKVPLTVRSRKVLGCCSPCIQVNTRRNEKPSPWARAVFSARGERGVQGDVPHSPSTDARRAVQRKAVRGVRHSLPPHHCLPPSRAVLPVYIWARSAQAARLAFVGIPNATEDE